MNELTPTSSHPTGGFRLQNLFSEQAAHWYFWLSLAAFIILKIPHLSVPFFWDETGVYGRMVFILHDEGLSMSPKAIDMWISRGHPLLYPNLIAAVCQLFGDNVTVAHAANFTFACGLIVSMFFCVKKIFNSWISLMAAVLIMATPNFFTQSVLVLPEVALAFFLWWTTWAFIQKKYLLYFLAGSAAVLIKEPAIIWIGALLAWDLFQIRKLRSWKVLFWSSPILVFALFLLWQKQTLGWYFFPFHSGGFEFTFNGIKNKLFDYMSYLFWQEGRFIWTGVLLIGLIGVVLRKTGSSTNSILPVPTRTYCFLFAALIYLLFSSTTFFHQRYVLPLYPPLCVLIAYLAYHFAAVRQNRLALLFLIIATYTAFQFHAADKFNYDCDMSYLRSVESTKKTVDYLLKNKMIEGGKYSATMPVNFALMEARFGYMPPGTAGTFTIPIHKETVYAIQVIPGWPIENPENLPLELIDSWNDHDIQTNIFKVVRQDTIR